VREADLVPHRGRSSIRVTDRIGRHLRFLQARHIRTSRPCQLILEYAVVWRRNAEKTRNRRDAGERNTIDGSIRRPRLTICPTFRAIVKPQRGLAAHKWHTAQPQSAELVESTAMKADRGSVTLPYTVPLRISNAKCWWHSTMGPFRQRHEGPQCH